MIEPWAASSADRADDRFCERCGSPARPAANLRRRGLSTCRACGIHACLRCWARSAGSCPACGVSIAAASPLRPMPVGRVESPKDAAPIASRRLLRVHGRLAAAGAVGMLVVTAIAFPAGLRVPTGPSGQVAGIVGIPGDASDRPSPSDSIATTSAPAEGGGWPPAAAGHGSTDGTGAPPPGGSTPEMPGPTPTSPTRSPSASEPTATPTPTPTLRPTSTPTPIPTATPCLRVAPQLTGERRNDAPAIWSQAGFSGTVTALEGHGNYLIVTQSRTAGHEYPCDAGVTVGP